MGDVHLRTLSWWVMAGLRVLTQKELERALQRDQWHHQRKNTKRPMVTSLTTVTLRSLTQWDIVGPITGMILLKKEK